eukprot:1388211-Amphidinium_carterae.1
MAITSRASQASSSQGAAERIWYQEETALIAEVPKLHLLLGQGTREGRATKTVAPCSLRRKSCYCPWRLLLSALRPAMSSEFPADTLAALLQSCRPTVRERAHGQ